MESSLMLKRLCAYIEQKLHLLWEQPVVTCRRMELASLGGLNIFPS
jgi:hypothetical protein